MQKDDNRRLSPLFKWNYIELDLLLCLKFRQKLLVVFLARLAGKLRYMDSRVDEQERGITMKSSVVSLVFRPLLVNLIDSPGHVRIKEGAKSCFNCNLQVDFLAEVNSALNVADIALLVVDVVEGVCSQTEALLRQAIANKIQIILVINKLDRLIIELKMSEAEAFAHLTRLIENVNSCASQILQGALREEEWSAFEAAEAQIHFDVARGNVLFSSAIYGWAFGARDFAKIWSERLKVDERELAERLFTDAYLSGSGKICANAEKNGRRALFEQLVLQVRL